VLLALLVGRVGKGCGSWTGDTFWWCEFGSGPSVGVTGMLRGLKAGMV
jgi:hypothetical protein